MTDWNYSTNTTDITKWTRSWRQELYTDLGTDFKLVAHMENVTTLATGEIIHTPLPAITRQMSLVATDPDVILLQEVLTRLVKKYLDEDIAAAAPVVEPPPTQP